MVWLVAVPALAEAPAASDAAEAPTETTTAPLGHSPWRLRLEVASSYEYERERTYFVPRIQFAWTASPHASLQLGFGVEGLGLGIRVHGETVGGWELWWDVNAGFTGYSSIEGVFVGMSTGVGVSLRVNERFLVGPFVRYAHTLQTTSPDRDYTIAGLQVDFHIDRRAHRRAQP
jgi:hypothetical protein